MEVIENNIWFREQILSYVYKVAIITLWWFEVIRRSVKKTDKNDTYSLAFLSNKDMLSEMYIKSKVYIELALLIATRDQLVKFRIVLLNKAHSSFIKNGLKVKKESLTTKINFSRIANSYKWNVIEKIELRAIAEQLQSIKNTCKMLGRKFIIL